MKIAILTTSFPLSETATITHPATYQLARALKQIGHDVIVCTFGSGDQPPLVETEVGGVRVFAARWDDAARRTCFDGPRTLNVFSWQLSRARLMAEAFEQVFDRFKPDIIECQEFNGLAFFVAARREVPMLIRCHGPMAHLMRGGFTGEYPKADTELVEAMELSTLAIADGICAVSKDIAERLSTLSGRPLGDWDIIRAPFALRNPVTATGGTANNPPTIFFLGRVDKLKGADLVLEAYIKLVQRFPDLRLVVGGSETVEEGETEPYANRMRARLQECGLSKQSEFLGFLSREEIERRASEATVCVFPSRYETCCYAALEAIDYGGAVVATKAGGLPEYHEHGTSAWLVEPENVEALTEGIAQVIGNPEVRAKLLANAKSYIQKQCDPSTIAQESVRAYEKAIARFNQRTPGNAGERAFQLFARHLMLALDDQPIWAQYPAQTEQAPKRENPIRRAARATKRLLRTGSK